MIWTLLAAEGVATVLALTPGLEGNRWVYFGLASLATQWVALLTLGSLYIVRSALTRLKPLQIASLSIALMLACTWVVCGLAWLALGESWQMDRDSLPMALLRISAIAVTVGILGLSAFHNHWRTRQLAVQTKHAQLEALRARIQPHFLFNTLNTAAALVQRSPLQAEHILMNLADLFRAALNGPDQDTLEAELTLTRRYLEIEQARLGTRLTVQWDMPSPLPAIKIPLLSIQPLVENAICHGIEPSVAGGSVHIRVEHLAQWVRVEVRNLKLPDGERPSRSHQVGLQAVRARLAALGSGRAQLLTAQQGNDYVSTLHFPMDEW